MAKFTQISALYLRRQHELEASRKTQKMFSRLKTKDWWKVSVPWVLPFHWLQRSKHSLNTNTVTDTRQLHQHATFSYSHTHHMNSHHIISTVPSGAQLHYVPSKFSADSPKTFGSRLMGHSI